MEPYSPQEENRADITLKNKNGKPIFFIELKDPTAKDGKSVFDSGVLMREVERAQKFNIKYFGNCNFLACAFFDKDKLYEKVSVNEGFFTLADISRLSQSYSPSKEILNRLRTIAQFYIDRAIEILERKPIKFSPLDELFIFKIRKLIEVYAYPISNTVWEKYRNDKSFEKEIQRYSQSQLWNKPSTYDEIENLTYISVLMLISKLIFYKSYVDNQTWSDLHPMQVPDSINTPIELEELIWKYFETFKEVTGNFELLIGERSDIIFNIPFVSDAAIDLVKEVLDTEGHYNFSNIPFDIIGRIFEELIREDERHKLGQYFTPPNVIDLINAFAIHKSNDKIFDPSCGSGTFLVRAYERKKLLCAEEDKGARHEILLNEIYGNDLSGYPAYLSMLNLAIRNTRKPSYPRIANKDFFAITENTKVAFHNQQGEKESRPLPKFDAIIGNPPYTRQEDIGTMRGTVNKAKIQSLIKAECDFQPSQRTSIYGYFFYHASVFLKDKGYLAFICQNSWLDTDYGIDMQRYLLRNYEIVAIIDSEVERFFPSASVNTTIVIARKQRDEDARNANMVKFVYFTSTLAEAIKKYKGVNKLQTIIQASNDSATNESFHLNCIQQNTLSKFTKWGQFLKAPQVYFDIIEKGIEKFVTVKDIADEIKFGIKTGCNDFFIVKEVSEEKEGLLKAVLNNYQGFKTIKQVHNENLALVENGFNELWLIEKQFLFPMLTSPKDVKTYSVNSNKLPYSVFIIDEEKNGLKSKSPHAFSYIIDAEKKQINKASSLAARNKWYFVGSKKVPAMSFSYIINDFGKTFLVDAFSNNNFHNIYSEKKSKTIWLYMNSTVSWLIQQLIMRSNLGEGAGKIETYDLAAFPFPEIDLESLKVDLVETKNYKDELGTLESLSNVNPERLKLDSAILEAIGYQNKEEREEVLLELYRATYQLINARLQKAQSLKGVKAQRNKVEFSVYVEQLKEMLVEGKYEAKNTFKFAKQLEKLVFEISSESKLQKKILDSYWKEKFGEFFNEAKIASQEQGKLF
ncbi:HsdM family class I SAM-dependent methyltransferase [Mucilaginibacter sp.]|uniref:HsdM family class I SAM-dependent methyltransferase n=1 Tax=Mucilaginibacter sp. TaxID=1882438 RepID=UPI003B00F348